MMSCAVDPIQHPIPIRIAILYYSRIINLVAQWQVCQLTRHAADPVCKGASWVQ